jgi:hypothetical protein
MPPADVNDNNAHSSGTEPDSKDDDDKYAPSTVLIMLGSMHFEHSGNADVLSLKIANPEERLESLQNARNMIQPNSLQSLHVVLKSSAVSSLFDETVLSMFYDGMESGVGEVMVHVLPESSTVADDMPVQAGDVDAIRMGLIVAGYRLESEMSQDGSWILVARKPGGSGDDDDEEEADELDKDNDGSS